MGASFNAGSIEGTLDLDSRPFTAGLLKAKEQARRFVNEKLTKQIDLDLNTALADEKMAKFDKKLDVLDKKKITPKVDANTKEAQAKLDALSAKDINATLDLDTGEAMAKLAALNLLSGKAMSGGGGGGGGFSAKIPMIVGGIATLMAALGPASVAVAAFGTAAVGAFAGAGVSLGLFAGVAVSQFKKIQEANKAGLDLTGPAGKAQDALAKLSGAWDKLLKQTEKNTFGTIGKTFGMLSGVLSQVAPLMNTTAVGVGKVVDSIAKMTQGSVFKEFLTTLESFMGGFLNGLGPVLTDMLSGLMNLFIAGQPLFSMLGDSIESMMASFDSWSQGLADNGLVDLMDNLTTYGPGLKELLGDLMGALGAIAEGLGPLAGPAIKFLSSLMKLIQQIDLKSLAAGFGDLLDGISPLMPVLGDLVNVILPPLGALLSVVGAGLAGLGAHRTTTGALVAMAVTVMVLVKAWKLYKAAVIAAAAAQVAINLAMASNPIGIVILAIAALVAGLIYAYNHSEKFRAAVTYAFKAIKSAASSTWNWIKNNWELLVTILGGPIGLAIVAIVKNFDKVKAAVRSVGRIFVSIYNALIGPVLSFIITGVGKLLVLWGKMLSLLGRAPGFGWAKKAGADMQSAGREAQGLGDAVRHIPTDIEIKARADTAAAVAAIERLNNATRKAGGSTHYTTGYGGGQKGNARGTEHWQGGRTLVGEEGPEIVDLPKGSKIRPADQTQSMMARTDNYKMADKTASVDVLSIMNAAMQKATQVVAAASEKNALDMDAIVKALTEAFTKAQVESSKKIIATQRGK